MHIEAIVMVIIIMIIVLAVRLNESFRVGTFDAFMLLSILCFGIWAARAEGTRKIEEVGIYSVNTIVEDNRAYSYVLITNLNYVNEPKIFPVDIITEKARVTTYATKSWGVRFKFSPIIEPYDFILGKKERNE